MKWWGILCSLVVVLSFARPVQAETWLYRTDAAGASLRVLAAPGDVVPGAPSIRRLAERENIRNLTVAERNTLQPNYVYHASFAPNDPQFFSQWNFPQINIPTAWDSDQVTPFYGGDPNVIVAVIDTGVSFENYQSYLAAPDFQGTTFWTNPAEISGDGIDNDHDGLVDDIHGWDFVNNDAHPNDDNGHGTHVTGTIAETTDNSLAAAGIAWHSTIMPLKGLDHTGSGTTDIFVAAINYAVDHGADIINLSLGGHDHDPMLATAIQAAIDQGIVIVAATGNDGLGTVNYPAKYAGVVAVGAVQYDATKTAYSNYGPELALMAPGGNLAVDQNNDGLPDGIYQQTCTNSTCSSFNTYPFSGTSQAAAHVSAVAALLEACGAASGTVLSTLETTATDLGSAGRDDSYGYGLINAAAALTSAGCSSNPPAPPSVITGRSAASTTVPLFTNHAYPYSQPVFSWAGPAGATYQVRWGRVGQAAVLQAQTTTKFSPKISIEGVYQLTVNTIDPLGRTSSPQKFSIRYRRPVIVVALSSSIRLYTVTGNLIRSWPSQLGSAASQAVGGSLEPDETNRIIVTDRQPNPTAKILATNGTVVKTLTPFGSTFPGSIDAAIVDSSTAEPQLVVSTASRGAAIRWYRPTGAALAQQLLYKTYRGGLRLASGDLDGDGQDELIVVQAKGPEVRVYNRARQRLSVFKPLGSGYQGGWRVTSGDWEGDGQKEIALVPAGGSAAMPVFVTTLQGTVKKVWRIRIYKNTQPVDIAAVDLNGDGHDELLALPAQAPLTLYQWSLGGNNPKTIKLSSDRDGLLSSLR